MSHIHNFDAILDRRGSDSEKWTTFANDVLPLWVADSDFTCPQPIIDALTKRIEHGAFGYPAVPASYAKAAKHWMETRHNCLINTEDILFINSVVPGLMDCIDAFTEKGDKVLIQSPVYPPFYQVIEDSERIKVTSPLIEQDNHFIIDYTDLEQKLSDPALKLMILCNPHNPVGRAWKKDELTKLAQLCIKHNVILVSDDIHQDLVFAPHKYTPVLGISEEIKNNSVMLINPSKTFNIPGMRSAAILVPNKDLRKQLQKTIAHRKSANPSVLGLIAFETAYTQCAWYVDQLIPYLQANRDYAIDFIETNIPKLKVTRLEATYLLWLDFKAYQKDQGELYDLLLQKGKIALNNGSTFGDEGNGFFRLNFACSRNTLQDGLKRMQKALKDL